MVEFLFYIYVQRIKYVNFNRTHMFAVELFIITNL